MELNKIYQEPCLDTLKRMPSNYLDCVITSPPYWQLRDYGYPEQWGLEPTFNEYLEHLWEMMNEIHRVLKTSGTVWVNLGDTYNGNKTGNSDPKLNDTIHISQVKKETQKAPNKSLLLLPHRFAIGCIDRGWIVRNDIIWAKRNGMPESVTDRFSKKHEYFFFMVKSEKYFFDLDSVRDKVKTESLERYKYNFSGNKGGIERDMIGYVGGNKKHLLGEAPQYSVLDKDFRNPIVEVRDLPEHEDLRKYLSDARKLKGITIQNIEDTFGSQAPHHWFENGGSYPTKENWIALKNILQFDNTYDEQMTNVELKSGLKQNNPKGKNPGSVSDFWDIPTKPSSNEHYAAYNDELLKKPILSGCPEFVCNKCGKPREKIIERTFTGESNNKEAKLQITKNYVSGGTKNVTLGRTEFVSTKVIGLTDCGCNAGFKAGIVYDPFMGTGSTAEIALRTNRNYIGSEMSVEYCKISEQRLNPYKQQISLF
jgi:DNA modification methylase